MPNPVNFFDTFNTLDPGWVARDTTLGVSNDGKALLPGILSTLGHSWRRDAGTGQVDITMGIAAGGGGDAVEFRAASASSSDFWRVRWERNTFSQPSVHTEYLWRAVYNVYYYNGVAHGASPLTMEKWSRSGSVSPNPSSYAHRHTIIINGVAHGPVLHSHNKKSDSVIDTQRITTYSTGYSGFVHLERVDGGVPTTVGLFSVGSLTPAFVRVVAVGDSILVYRQGATAPILRRNDVTYAANSWVGPARAGPSEITGSALYEFDLKVLVSPPTAPLLISPRAGDVLDPTSLVFSWRFSDVDPGDTQTSWSWRFKTPTGAYQWWDKALGQLSATEVQNTGTDQSLDITALALAVGDYQWSANTWDSANIKGTYSADEPFGISNRPLAQISYPVEGDIIADTTAPRLVGEAEDIDGDIIISHRWRVYTVQAFAELGAPLYNSGIIAGSPNGETHAMPLGLLPNVADYVYTLVASTEKQESQAAIVTSRLEVQGPARPIIDVVYTPHVNLMGIQAGDNRLSEDNAGFETSLGDWLPSPDVTLTRTTDFAISQTGAALVEAISAGDSSIYLSGTPVLSGKELSILMSLGDLGALITDAGVRVSAYDEQGGLLDTFLSPTYEQEPLYAPPPVLVESLQLTRWEAPRRTNPSILDGSSGGVLYASVTDTNFGTALASVASVAFTIDGVAENTDTVAPFDAGQASASSIAGIVLSEGTHTIQATVTRTAEAGGGVTTLTATVNAQTTQYRWNAGGNTIESDTGIAWESDGEEDTHPAVSVADPTAISDRSAEGLFVRTASAQTVPLPIGQTERYDGLHTWTFPASPGNHLVSLIFCEGAFSAVGQRVQNVEINGAVVESGLDVFAEAGGQYRIIKRDYRINVTGSSIVIRLIGTTRKATLSGGVIVGPLRPAPVAPTGLVTAADDGQVTVAWDRVVGAETYHVYRGGVEIAQTPTPQYIDTGRTNGVAYTYSVAAVNPAGDSPQSTSKTATPIAQASGTNRIMFNWDTNTALTGDARDANSAAAWAPVGTLSPQSSARDISQSGGADWVSTEKGKTLKINYGADTSVDNNGFSGYNAEVIIPNSSYGKFGLWFFLPSSMQSTLYGGATVGSKMPGFGCAGIDNPYSSTSKWGSSPKPPQHCVTNISSTEGWSMRHMWTVGGGMHLYPYWSGKSNNCGDTDYLTRPDGSPVSNRTPGWLQTGRWYYLEQEVSVPLGQVKVWIDGVLRRNSAYFNFHNQKINRMIFSPYVNKPGVEQKTYAYYKMDYMDLSA